MRWESDFHTTAMHFLPMHKAISKNLFWIFLKCALMVGKFFTEQICTSNGTVNPFCYVTEVVPEGSRFCTLPRCNAKTHIWYLRFVLMQSLWCVIESEKKVIMDQSVLSNKADWQIFWHNSDQCSASIVWFCTKWGKWSQSSGISN